MLFKFRTFCCEYLPLYIIFLLYLMLSHLPL
nr:MAG TPA: hypothetical protein [Caudoviricetes sp.]